MSEWTERKEKYRSKRYIPEKQLKMTNKELREENNKPITGETENRSKAIQTGKFISEALKIYISGDEERFNKYSDRLKKLVQTIYQNSIEGNNSTVQEMLNRVEGKVKDEIIIENKIAQHVPNQEKKEQIVGKFKNEESTSENTIQ